MLVGLCTAWAKGLNGPHAMLFALVRECSACCICALRCTAATLRRLRDTSFRAAAIVGSYSVVRQFLVSPIELGVDYVCFHCFVVNVNMTYIDLSNFS